MNLKPILLHFYLLYLATNLSAQTIEWSNQQKLKSKINYTQILGANGNGNYLIRSRSNEFARDLLIEKYKYNLTAEISKDLWQPPGSYIERIMLLENDIIIVASLKNNGKLDLVYWKLDETLSPATTPIQLLQIDLAVISDETRFILRQNQNKSIYTFTFITKGANKNTGVLNIATLNNQFVLQLTKQFPLNFPPEDVVLTNVECDNQNNIHVLIDFPKIASSKKKKDIRDFYLYSYFHDKQELVEYKMGDDTLIIEDIAITVNNVQNEVLVGGLYKSLLDKQHNGSFMIRLDITEKIIKLNSFEQIDKSFINKINSTMLSSELDGFDDIYIRKLIARSDGGCIIVAEKFYETRQTYTYYVNGYPQTSFKSVYNYDEIIFLNKKPDGTTENKNFIKKKQSSMQDGGYYSSFITMNTNDRIAFIYNSDVSTESDVMISSFAPDGQLDTRVLIKSLSFYISVMPSEFKQISHNAMLAGTMKDKRFSLMRITF